ncbi:unnamed protein product [Brassica rapa subsp. trilocularis]
MYEHPDLESPLFPPISSTSRVPSESSLATNQDDITEVDLRKESPSTTWQLRKMISPKMILTISRVRKVTGNSTHRRRNRI